MPTIQVDTLSFHFPDVWRVHGKYDDWSFYRNQFIKMFDGIKSMDIVAVDQQNCLWLIDGKDYRLHRREKSTSLPLETAKKTLDTLAGLAAAQVNANDLAEKRMAQAALSSVKIRVVLHLEQPSKHSKLHPRAFLLANIQQELRRLVKPIDPHALVLEIARPGTVGWTVT